MIQFRRLLFRYQSFISPVVGLIIVLCSVIFIIFPLVQQTLHQFQDVSVLREQVNILQQKVTILNNLDESSLEQNVILTTSAIPIEKSLPTILSTMEGISDKTGITLRSLVIDSPGSLASDAAKQKSTEEKKIGAFSIPFSVTLGGEFDQIITFLATSNTVRRLVRAKSFTLNFSDEELTTQISFETFYAPLSNRNETEILKVLKDSDFDLLARLEQFPNMGAINSTGSSPSFMPTEVKSNPFSL